ncbi:MAG TPA: hypothetical protein VES42_22700, partial [Pilimelia sp.]|nr:hypothetical protein [Pilimelia sp.]
GVLIAAVAVLADIAVAAVTAGAGAGAGAVLGVTAVVVAGVPVGGVAADVTRRGGASGRSTTGSVGSGLLGRAAGVLYGDVGTRYAEEWRGELYDLRAEGARWWQRAGYVIGVLLWAAPVVAVTSRLSRARAVD